MAAGPSGSMRDPHAIVTQVKLYGRELCDETIWVCVISPDAWKAEASVVVDGALTEPNRTASGSN
jgi:hypothetical protein